MLRRYIFPFLLVSCTLPLGVSAETDAHPDAQIERGERLFDKYCTRCHGEKADGEGRMVKRLYRKKGTQLPTNFTIQLYADRTDEYLRTIITQGGEANDMSRYMPPFGEELSTQDVDDLVVFVKVVAENRAKPEKSTRHEHP